MRRDSRSGTEIYVRLEQVGTALPHLQFGGKEDNGPRWVDLKLGLQLRPGEPCFCAALHKGLIVHRVRDKELRNVSAEVVAPVLGVQCADGQHGVYQGLQTSKEEPFCRPFRNRTLTVSEPRFRPQQDWNS